jgi:hypothetical protein
MSISAATHIPPCWQDTLPQVASGVVAVTEVVVSRVAVAVAIDEIVWSEEVVVATVKVLVAEVDETLVVALVRVTVLDSAVSIAVAAAVVSGGGQTPHMIGHFTRITIAHGSRLQTAGATVVHSPRSKVVEVQSSVVVADKVVAAAIVAAVTVSVLVEAAVAVAVAVVSGGGQTPHMIGHFTRITIAHGSRLQTEGATVVHSPWSKVVEVQSSGAVDVATVNVTAREVAVLVFIASRAVLVEAVAAVSGGGQTPHMIGHVTRMIVAHGNSLHTVGAIAAHSSSSTTLAVQNSIVEVIVVSVVSVAERCVADVVAIAMVVVNMGVACVCVCVDRVGVVVDSRGQIPHLMGHFTCTTAAQGSSLQVANGISSHPSSSKVVEAQSFDVVSVTAVDVMGPKSLQTPHMMGHLIRTISAQGKRLQSPGDIPEHSSWSRVSGPQSSVVVEVVTVVSVVFSLVPFIALDTISGHNPHVMGHLILTMVLHGSTSHMSFIPSHELLSGRIESQITSCRVAVAVAVTVAEIVVAVVPAHSARRVPDVNREFGIVSVGKVLNVLQIRLRALNEKNTHFSEAEHI